VQLGSMRDGEAHIGEHIGLGVVEQCCQLRHLGADLIRNVPPLLACSLASFWAKAVAMKARDHPPTLLSCMGQHIAHEMDAAALPSRIV
jgi:hypothetical protein